MWGPIFSSFWLLFGGLFFSWLAWLVFFCLRVQMRGHIPLGARQKRQPFIGLGEVCLAILCKTRREKWLLFALF
ncbi:MAG: hypothetical protein D6805_09850 [Planctomycetota bacterium]|nr:MAG: hypothetical protein D6805_09850 [Planctomycetota bacterium]